MAWERNIWLSSGTARDATGLGALRQDGSEEVGELVAQHAGATSSGSPRRPTGFRAGDVWLEQALAQLRRGRGTVGDHRDLRVAIQRPRVEVDGAEAHDVVG